MCNVESLHDKYKYKHATFCGGGFLLEHINIMCAYVCNSTIIFFITIYQYFTIGSIKRSVHVET